MKQQSRTCYLGRLTEGVFQTLGDGFTNRFLLVPLGEPTLFAEAIQPKESRAAQWRRIEQAGAAGQDAIVLESAEVYYTIKQSSGGIAALAAQVKKSIAKADTNLKRPRNSNN